MLGSRMVTIGSGVELDLQPARVTADALIDLVGGVVRQIGERTGIPPS
jgi:hypothetical protein